MALDTTSRMFSYHSMSLDRGKNVKYTSLRPSDSTNLVRVPIWRTGAGGGGNSQVGRKNPSLVITGVVCRHNIRKCTGYQPVSPLASYSELHVTVSLINEGV